MRYLASVTYMLCTFAFLYAQQSDTTKVKSDYAIVKSFESKYNDIKESIRKVTNVDECAALSTEIDNLEKEFASDTVLLNNALYPDKYDNWIGELRVELRLAQDKLGIIESQVSRIAELQQEVQSLSTRIDSIANENQKLIASLNVMSSALTRNAKTIDSLKNIVARLQRGLRARDEAILAMTDSLFVQYGTNVSGLSEQQKNTLVEKVQRYNVVKNIKNAAEQNVQFLRSTQLSSKDIISMIKDQRRFDSYWKGLGPKLASLYASGKRKENEISSVDAVIKEWGDKADSTLWATLNNEFVKAKIALDPFHNADEFIASLSNYFDQQGGDPKASDNEKAGKLNHFLNDVWNPNLGSQVIPALVDQGIITKEQQNQLQTKLAAWEKATKPSHTFLFAAIVIVAVIVVIIISYRGRKKTSPPAAKAEG